MYTASYLSKFFWDRLALVWAFYFLWVQDVTAALAVGSLFFAVGVAASTMLDPKLVKSERLERFFTWIHSPLPTLIRHLGVLLLVFSFAEHSTGGIALGLLILIVGHLEWTEPPLSVFLSKHLNKELVTLSLRHRIRFPFRVFARLFQG